MSTGHCLGVTFTWDSEFGIHFHQFGVTKPNQIQDSPLQREPYEDEREGSYDGIVQIVELSIFDAVRFRRVRRPGRVRRQPDVLGPEGRSGPIYELDHAV